MAKLPLPERGQPLDLSYIYNVAQVVNELSEELTSSSARYTSIDTAAAGKQTLRTSDARIIGGYRAVTNNSSTSPDGEGTFVYEFEDFAYVPVVTATPILIEDGTTESGKDISVILTKVTANKVEGLVKFNTIGVASVGVNLLIVGVPI